MSTTADTINHIGTDEKLSDKYFSNARRVQRSEQSGNRNIRYLLYTIQMSSYGAGERLGIYKINIIY
jgi:hypothetical protein